MSTNMGILIVILLYLAVNLFVGIYVGKMKKGITTGGFLRDYFIGGRSMGGFVLAMTLIATYTSASSFLSGPGLGTTRGLTQTFVAVIQVGTAFVTLGIIGKKFALVSRKINAVSISDYMRARYKSSALVILSSIAMIAFFITNMVAQFVGGAVLFETITGLPYIGGLLLFGGVVIIYCTYGGFKGVVTTDTIQGVVMTLGTALLVVYALKAGGGINAIADWLNANRPGWDLAGMGPLNKARINTPGFVTSYWVLVGIATLGLPQQAVRGMGFKSTEAMHRAMLYGTFVVGFLMIGMHMGGLFAAPILPGKDIIKTTDYIIPWFAMNYMPSGIAGLMLAAPLAAVMSTVSSLLILASATIIKDVYLNYVVKKDVDKTTQAFQNKLSKISFFATFIIGAICLLIAVQPPDIIVWINLFALGGLEAIYFWPIILGLYWRKANTTGCFWSVVLGVSTFVFFNRVKIMPYNIHEIVPGLIIGGLAFVIGSLASKQELDKKTLEVFYGE